MTKSKKMTSIAVVFAAGLMVLFNNNTVVTYRFTDFLPLLHKVGGSIVGNDYDANGNIIKVDVPKSTWVINPDWKPPQDWPVLPAGPTSQIMFRKVDTATKDYDQNEYHSDVWQVRDVAGTAGLPLTLPFTYLIAQEFKRAEKDAAGNTFYKTYLFKNLVIKSVLKRCINNLKCPSDDPVKDETNWHVKDVTYNGAPGIPYSRANWQTGGGSVIYVLQNWYYTTAADGKTPGQLVFHEQYIEHNPNLTTTGPEWLGIGKERPYILLKEAFWQRRLISAPGQEPDPGVWLIGSGAMKDDDILKSAYQIPSGDNVVYGRERSHGYRLAEGEPGVMSFKMTDRLGRPMGTQVMWNWATGERYQ